MIRPVLHTLSRLAPASAMAAMLAACAVTATPPRVTVKPVSPVVVAPATPVVVAPVTPVIVDDGYRSGPPGKAKGWHKNKHKRDGDWDD